MEKAIVTSKWIPAGLFGIVLSVACAVVLMGAAAAEVRPGCERDTLSTSMSPDESWQAIVLEEICTDGAFVTTITNTAQLVRRGAVPRREDDIFAIDAAGQPENSLVVQWLSNHQLQITIPIKSTIGLQKASHEGIEIVAKRIGRPGR